MSNESKNELDLAFEELERECGSNREIRREMIEALRRQISKMEISEFDKAMMVQAKLSYFGTLDSLLKSDEDLSFKKLKMKLARKDSETNGMIGATITNLLRSIKVNDPQLKGEAAAKDPTEGAMDVLMEKTDALLKEGGDDAKKLLNISEGELEACSDIPSTDNASATLKPIDELEDSDE